jgi:hypothetical protein
MNLTAEVFFAGAGGAILGALISTWLAYRFQRLIHIEQMEAQQKSQEAFLASIRQLVEVHANANTGLKLQLHAEGQSIVTAINSLKSGDFTAEPK